MMPPMATLRAEHGHALVRLSLLDDAADRLRKYGRREDEMMLIEDGLQFLENFLAEHCDVEETSVFPMLHADEETTALRERLRDEHGAAQRAWTKASVLFNDLRSAEAGETIPLVSDAILTVVRMLRAHIEGEERSVYADARRVPARALQRDAAGLWRAHTFSVVPPPVKPPLDPR
jgi:hemerythrin-like domain-containing protein